MVNVLFRAEGGNEACAAKGGTSGGGSGLGGMFFRGKAGT